MKPTFIYSCVLLASMLAGVDARAAETSENIVFDDAKAKAIYVANWDKNNDGELSIAKLQR